MGRRKKAEPQPRLGAIHLGSAVVPADNVEPKPVTQAEAEAALGVTDRTLRNWAEIGLPVRKGPHGRPIYPAEDCRTWVACWREVTTDCQRYKRAAPRSLTLLQALNWRALRRAADGYVYWNASRLVAALGVEWLDLVVIVPNDCEGWDRARALRLAVEGIASEEEYPDPSDEQLLADHGVPRGYSRPDLGWPAAPDLAAA